MMAHGSTLRSLLERGAADAPALAGADRPVLTYSRLRDQLETTKRDLNALGVGQGATVAIVLPNGPAMATAFLGIGAVATAAPLNPAYRADEFEFFLGDLDARLLVIAHDDESPARAVAAKRGIAVAELVLPADAPAGVFELRSDRPAGPPVDSGWAGTEETALVLHTSGTTSRPKIVPLSHRNVCASAAHIAECLQLTSGDRCLNVMPLFHIHGLMAALLASLAVGGSVWCAPGFSALAFFRWMGDADPSWYTAVPTMHQAVLARAARHRDVIARGRLRFVRSSSASLAPAVLRELEETFGVPVVEAYGMTEAAHQMTSNPLPPAARKVGSVGTPAGPEVGVMDADGRLLPPGETGEVVIRGPNVTTGYRGSPEANAAAFADGWFRTGDQGVIDEDGYLWLTGRLKEIINRGGEKISPREVDEVLLEHPAVSQAVTFAVPHAKLGEDVAVAVVRAPGATVTAADLRSYAAAHLADFKIPRKVLFVSEIPTGPTGKLQRIGLAAQLGLDADAANPST